MSEIKVNKISPRTNCGTVQLGDSGDTITIPAGASITNSGTASGFGATGSASWVTTKKTATFTATAGEGYFCDTSGGAFTVNLPSSPSAGAVVAVSDYANTFDTNNLTIGRGGSNIEGAASDFVCNIEGAAITLVYVDATQGWITTDTGNSTDAFINNFVEATVSGSCNSLVTCGNFKIAVFKGPGTFEVTSAGTPSGSTSVDYLVVGGGGGTSSGPSNPGWGGGGGAGGYRESPGSTTCYTASPLGASPATAITVSKQSYPITVGAGGAGSAPKGTSGGNSSALGIQAAGGGGGGGYTEAGINGGSGGGGGGCGSSGTGGSGNTPPVSPAQGSDGGNGKPTGNESGGGGGGASSSGADGGAGPGSSAGNGGNGTNTGILGSSPLAPSIGAPGPAPGRFFGGGGGGGNGRVDQGGNPTTPGGTGGGGTGGSPPSYTGGSGPGTNGVATTGGGAGAMGGNTGGSGIVIIRYKFQ